MFVNVNKIKLSNFSSLVYFLIILFLIAGFYVLSIENVFAGNSNASAGSAPGLDSCTDPNGDGVVDTHPGDCGDCNGIGGGGGVPRCIPCTQPCFSEENRCGIKGAGTEDPCCGRGCTAQVPPLPTTTIDGTEYTAFDSCTVSDVVCGTTIVATGTIDCSGKCSAQILSYRCPTTTPTTTPSTTPSTTTPNIPGTYTPETCKVDNFCDTFPNHPICTPEATSSVENITVATTTHIPGTVMPRFVPTETEKTRFVYITSAPRMVKKNYRARIFLFKLNLDSCDIISSDGVLYKRVGKDRTLGLADFISHPIKSKTEFRVVQCYIKGAYGEEYAYYPTEDGWIFATSSITTEENASALEQESKDKCGTTFTTYVPFSTITQGGVSQQSSIIPENENSNLSDYNSATDETENTFSNSSNNSDSGEFSVNNLAPQLPNVKNKTSTTVYLAPSWKEQ